MMATLRDGFLVGFDADMSEAEYLADPCPTPALSSHIAKLLVGKSPAHAYAEHPRLGGGVEAADDERKHFDLGGAVHALLLGKGRRLVTCDYPNWQTKAAKEARSEAYACGSIPMLPPQRDRVVHAAAKMAHELERRGIRLTGTSELSIFWVETADDGTPVQCKGRLDHFIESEGDIYDLKSSRTAHPRAIPKHVDAYGYDVQWAAYTRGIEVLKPELAGRTRYRWIFAELRQPFAVTVASPAGSLRVLGASRWRRAVNLWASCTSSGEWPAYIDEELQVEAPPWAMSDEMSAGMSSDVPFGGDDDEEGEAA